MSLVTWGGKLLLSPNGKLTLGPAAAACCCEGAVGCFTCIITSGTWEIDIQVSLTGCYADLNGDWGWFTIYTHPDQENWCRASGTLPGACGYPILGFYLNWQDDGTLELQIIDLTASPVVVLTTLVGTATTCEEMEASVELTGEDGVAVVSIRPL